MNHPPLVLASTSPRRQALLRAGGVDFDIQPAQIDENAHLNGRPRVVALRTALAKALDVVDRLPHDALVLAADTLVVWDGRIFNKPANREEAAATLRQLAGRAHRVITGLALIHAAGAMLVDAVDVRVRFHPLDEGLIADYVASGEADDKAGAYGIQGPGARFVAAVEGDLSCVIGLPLVRLRQMGFAILGDDLFDGRSLRRIDTEAFPELSSLPASCFDGLPD